MAVRYAEGTADSEDLDTTSLVTHAIDKIVAKMAANTPVHTPDWSTLRVYTDTINTNWPQDMPTVDVIGVVMYSVE